MGAIFGTRDFTKVLIYPSFSLSKIPVFLRPLKLFFANSAFPKIASLASAVVKFLRFVRSVPPWSLITSSTFLSLGGVLKGGGGILVLDAGGFLVLGSGESIGDADLSSDLSSLLDLADSHCDDENDCILLSLSLADIPQLLR